MIRAPLVVTHKVLKRLQGVLILRLLSGSLTADQDRRARVTRIVERMSGIGRAVVFEDVFLEPFERDHAQESRGHDAVRVEVVTPERERAASDERDGSQCVLAGAGAA